MSVLKTEVAVVGGGPAGLTAALALAHAGIETALITKSPPQDDHRTTVLLRASVSALQALGVWPRCEGSAAALRRMRIVDDTARLLRAPELTFDAAEIGLEAFGYNVQNRDLLVALVETARDLKSSLVRIDSGAQTIATGEHEVAIAL